MLRCLPSLHSVVCNEMASPLSISHLEIVDVVGVATSSPEHNGCYDVDGVDGGNDMMFGEGKDSSLDISRYNGCNLSNVGIASTRTVNNDGIVYRVNHGNVNNNRRAAFVSNHFDSMPHTLAASDISTDNGLEAATIVDANDK